jgi:hypothetical protein
MQALVSVGLCQFALLAVALSLLLVVYYDTSTAVLPCHCPQLTARTCLVL